MLDLMRKHARSWFIKVLLGGIVVTFISWGGYSRYQERSNTVAYINGESLMIQEFERAYYRVLNIYRAQMPDLDEEAIKNMGLRQKVYDDLVERMLMLQEADRLGLKVSEAELRERIRRLPAFQVEGHFDEELYQRVLAANKLSPAQYEEQERIQATMEKLRRLVMGFAKASEAEAFKDWQYRNEKAAVDYALFAMADFRDQVEISDEDISAYYEARKEGFRRPARVKIGYVVFDPKVFAEETAPSEEEVRQEYEQFEDDYWTAKEVKASHILITVPPTATKEQEGEAEEKALAILAQAKAGADFSELAKKHSQDPGSAAKGGDLGWFAGGQMVEAFEEAAFALEKGGLGGPVRTRYGYHVIKVDDVREPRKQSFEEVREDIVKLLSQERAEDLADIRLAESYGKVLKAGSVKSYAKEEGLEYQETDFLALREPVPGLPDSARVVEKAFQKKVGEFDSDVERDQGPVLFELVERREAYVAPLAEVAEAVRKKMVEEKTAELASIAATEAIKEVRGGAKFEAAAAKHGGKAGHVGPFLRTAAPPELGRAAATAAFRLSLEEPLGRLPYRSTKGWVIIRLTERQEPSPEEFAADKEEIMGRLVSFKRQGIFSEWLKRVREKADIEVVNEVT